MSESLDRTSAEAAEREKRRNWWKDSGASLVLALATMGSAWCAYQATLWGGVQTFRLADANRAGRLSSLSANRALTLESFDATMFIEWMKARHQKDLETEKFLYSRFRPEMKIALDAWLRTNPFENPNAPSGPFRMAEYVLVDRVESDRRAKESGDLLKSAMEAREISNRYVLLTVMFASVLFFAGIAHTFRSRGVPVVVLALAFLFFAATVIALVNMPLCRERTSSEGGFDSVGAGLYDRGR